MGIMVKMNKLVFWTFLRVWALLIVVCAPQSWQNNVLVSSRAPRKVWPGRWGGQEETLNRVCLDKTHKAALYTSSTQSEWQDQSLFTFFTEVWTYMTKTYGNFGPDNYLSLVIHQNHKPGHYLHPSHEFSLNPENQYQKNILNMGAFKFHPTEWASNENLQNTEKDKLLHYLAYFVEYSSKDRLGSPSYSVWKGGFSPWSTVTTWAHIFAYDVYKNLNLTRDSERYRKTSENVFSSYPKSDTFWFKNWFLPIYEHYGGTAVLNKYFDLLHDHFPTEAEKQYKYNGSLNMGGFVHFWSAAAGVNLKAIAQRAFGWTEDFDAQFLRAREEFSGLNLLYNADVSGLSNAGKTFEEDPEIELKRTFLENDLKPSPTEPKEPFTLPGHIVATGAAIGGTILLVLILALVACVVFQKRKIRKLSVPSQITMPAEVRNLSDEEVTFFFDGDPDVDPDSHYALVQSKPFIMDFEVPRDYMTLDNTKVLGKGQFGSVVSGSLCVKDDEWLIVAVKTVKQNVNVDYFQAFLSEVKIMAYIGRHTNIVELQGTCTTNIKNCEILIALEFCPLGNLQNYLKRNRSIFEDTAFGITTTFPSSTNTTEASLANKITTLDLLTWSQEIANGMTYLTEKKVIHGDLAARNVLLTKDRVAKISDFGLSRQFFNYANYHKTSTLPLPWRWLAVESLKEMEFSVASDVWAFGVTMWEIFSLAELPYSCWSWDLHFVDKLLSGDRLLRPINANPDVYKLMMSCWKLKPADRPSFQRIYDTLNGHISQLASNNRRYFCLPNAAPRACSTPGMIY